MHHGHGRSLSGVRSESGRHASPSSGIVTNERDLANPGPRSAERDHAPRSRAKPLGSEERVRVTRFTVVRTRDERARSCQARDRGARPCNTVTRTHPAARLRSGGGRGRRPAARLRPSAGFPRACRRAGPAPVLPEQLAAAAARHQRSPPACPRRRTRPAGRRRRLTSAETSPHSAHSVSPYEAFSTLQPTTIRPSSTSAAAPTGKSEYGAYARGQISRAALAQSAPSRCSAHFLVRNAVGGRCAGPVRPVRRRR